MAALASILVVVLLSLLITRIATMALVLTGMSREQARFQARSALTGVGFTTAEAESVVGHPVRRRIVMALMLVGGAGVVTVLGGVMLSFAGDDGRNGLKLAILVGGLAALVVLARSRRVDRFLQRPIEWGLRRFTDIEVRDFESLLHLAEGNVVIELGIDPGEWLDGRTLADADLRGEGVVVLGVQRPDGSYLAVPRGDTELRAGDTVIAYGLGERLCDLDERPAGPEGDRARARGARVAGRAGAGVGDRPAVTRRRGTARRPRPTPPAPPRAQRARPRAAPPPCARTASRARRVAAGRRAARPRAGARRRCRGCR